MTEYVRYESTLKTKMSLLCFPLDRLVFATDLRSLL
jgi:hypothetical protein